MVRYKNVVTTSAEAEKRYVLSIGLASLAATIQIHYEHAQREVEEVGRLSI